MNPHIYENSPFRRPQWRADRVYEMLDHRPLDNTTTIMCVLTETS